MIAFLTIRVPAAAHAALLDALLCDARLRSIVSRGSFRLDEATRQFGLPPEVAREIVRRLTPTGRASVAVAAIEREWTDHDTAMRLSERHVDAALMAQAHARGQRILEAAE